ARPKRYRLFDLPRRRANNAADAAGRAADHGLVPELPSRPKTLPAGARPDLQHELEGGRRSIRKGSRPPRRISHQDGTSDRLLAVPPMSMTRHKALQAAYDLDRRAALKLLGGGGLALTLAA